MPLVSGSAGGFPHGAGTAIGSQQTPAGPTSYSGNFIPEIWSGKLIEKFYDSTVLAAISNTDYEGELRNQGDTVHIRQRPSIVIRDYSPDTELQLQRPSAGIVDLTIDFAKYFATVADDVWRTQADMDMMDMWSQDAAEQMKINIDSEVLTDILLGGASADNRGTTAGLRSNDVNLGVTGTPLTVVPRAPTGGQVEITDLIVNMGQVLDEQNVPENDRFLVIPAWMSAMIKKSELRDASLSGDGTSILRNGRLGMIDRFTLYMSNLLPAGVAGGLAAPETAVFAGHKMGLTFASQMTKMESMRSELTFGTIVRGLQVYGAKVIKSEAVAEAIVRKP